MNKILTLLNSLPTPIYFYMAITLFTFVMYTQNEQSPLFWCVSTTSLNLSFAVVQILLPNNSTNSAVIGGVLVLILFCFWVVTNLSNHCPGWAPKAVFLFEILVFTSMAVVFCVMFGYFYVALCQHGRLLPQCLLWLLHQVGAVNLHACPLANDRMYHLVSSLMACLVLFSFTATIYQATPSILSLIRWVQSKCAKFWE